MLRWDLWDFSDTYIVAKGDITATNPDNARRNKAVAFKNNAPFINCISKITGVQIDNTEDLHFATPTCNLLEYNPLSSNSESFKYKKEILILLVMVKLVIMQTKLAKMKPKSLFH